MRPGRIVIEWNAEGRLQIKTSLPNIGTDGKKEALHILLDAAKAVNDSGSPLGLVAAPVKMLSGV